MTTIFEKKNNISPISAITTMKKKGYNERFVLKNAEKEKQIMVPNKFDLSTCKSDYKIQTFFIFSVNLIW